jgi:thiosulfate/3-mercaptopyruvate sulfurtransferase
VIPPVVDRAWWQAHRDAVVLADVRWYLDGRSGRAAYDAGHLPGAVFVDLDRWLAAPGSRAEGRHPLPSPEVFAEGMAALGIGDDDTVLAYDDGGGVTAARLVWMLRVTGHEAALLDGGLGAYDGPLDTMAPGRPRARFTARPWPAEHLADIEDAVDPAHVVLDARAPERFRGEVEPVDPRAGHIPGARSLPAGGSLDDDGRFLPVGVLRERFAAAGVTDGSSVVSYCGSGVTACHNLLALELAGFAPGRLYAGSWSQYSSDPGRPVATGGQVTVRPATPADHQRIGELTVDGYVVDGLAPERYLPHLADVARRAQVAEILVAHDADDSIVGAVALVLSGDFGEVLESDDEAAFRMLVVDPAARGRGVGELLVRACLARARAAGKRRMVLSTDVRMAAAHRLYERLGFTRLPERDWSPLPGVDLLVYVRDL